MAKNGLRWRTWVEKVNGTRSGWCRRGHLSARDRPPGAFSWRNLTNLNLTKTLTQGLHTPWPGGRRIIQCASARTAATVPLFALWSTALEALELEKKTLKFSWNSFQKWSKNGWNIEIFMKFFPKMVQKWMEMEVWGGLGASGGRLGRLLSPRWRPRAPRGGSREALMAILTLLWANLGRKWGPKSMENW